MSIAVSSVRLLLLCAMISSGVSAQSYLSMLVPGAAWQDENSYEDPGPSTSSYSCVHQYLSGDTVLADRSYSILRGTGVTCQNGQSTWFNGMLLGFLREDTAARRVYYARADQQYEYLLYDLSVDIGPYPWTFRYTQFPGLAVTEIDTVTLSDGPHRRIHLSNSDVIIEGVGATSGFLESSGSGIHWQGHLVCHTLNETPTYSTTATACLCGSLSTNSLESHQIRFHPSPTSGHLFISGAQPGSKYAISSANGEGLASGIIYSSTGTALDLTAFASGVYFVVIKNGSDVFRIKVLRE